MCGPIHDRDVNAAQNILTAGHRRLAEGLSVLCQREAQPGKLRRFTNRYKRMADQLFIAQESQTLVAATAPPLNRSHLPQSPLEALKNAHVPQRLLLSADCALKPSDERRLFSLAGMESKSKQAVSAAGTLRLSTRSAGAHAAALNTRRRERFTASLLSL
jgi:hypothetical protein